MDLDETKRVIAAATEGPWEARGPWLLSNDNSLLDDNAGGNGSCGRDEDAAFIAHARTALPEYVAEVERLREVMTPAEKMLDEVGITWQSRARRLAARAEAAEATIFRVREWLDADLRCDECPEDACVHTDTVRDYETTLRALLDGVSTPPSCGCRACTPADAPASMIVCETCGNKRCPHATHHDHPCTGSNEPGQPGSVYGGQPR